MTQQGSSRARGKRGAWMMWVGAAMVAGLLSGAPAGVGQVDPGARGGVQQPSGPHPIGAAPLTPPDAIVPNPRRLEHMREDERHKRLVADTAKLVDLTNELKAEVDKASKDELSVDVVKKAAEIEKLARDVKERMKN